MKLQHNLVAVDVNKKQIMKTEGKPECKKQDMTKLKMKPTDNFLNVGLKNLCLTTIMIYGDLLRKCAKGLR